MAKSNVRLVKDSASVGEVLCDSSDGNYQIIKLPDGRIAFVFDPARNIGPSKSGKTTLISSTKGALNLADLPTISVNVFK